MIWIVHAYSGTRYLNVAVPWGFKSREAAQWWVDNRADHSYPEQRYALEQIPLYSLEDIQSFTA